MKYYYTDDNTSNSKFSADSIEFTISEYVSGYDEFDRFEKYKETDDLLIYKIYYGDKATENFFETSANSWDLEYLEEYYNKCVAGDRKKFEEEYKIDNFKRSESAAQEAYEIYEDNGSCAMQVFVGVKNTTEFYVFRDGSPAFNCNFDAFLEGLIYLDSENSTNIPKDKLEDIGFTKTAKCMKLGFYIPEEVSLVSDENSYSDDDGYVKGVQYYSTDVMSSIYQISIPAMPADEPDEETTATDTATTTTTTTGADLDNVIHKFEGFWIWENEVDAYLLGGGYNGIDIGEAFYLGDGAKYDFLVTHGDSWTDLELTECSEEKLVFEWEDEILGHTKVVITYIDENTIECDGSRAIKSTSLGEPENIDTIVEQIRTWYYDTQNNLDNLLYASYDINLDCYFDGGYPAKVVAKSGYNDWNVTREYYYHDQELYFVFVYGDIGEYRFYIKNNVLVRSISPEGYTVDIGYGRAPDTWDVYDKVVAEEKAFPLMVNCGN